MQSSGQSVNTRLRMITFRTAFGGGSVTASLLVSPTLSPPPLKPELAPRPTMVLSEVTLCIGPGSCTMPCTWITSGPGRDAASRNSATVRTVTVGPPAPPVVPFWPSAFTDAKPLGASPMGDGAGDGLGDGIGVGAGVGVGVGAGIGAGGGGGAGA